VKKSTNKQTRRKQDQRRRREAERKHRQAAELAEAQLWRELEPRSQGYNLDDDDQFIEFASQVMLDSAVLHDEPEFHDLAFDPAEAMLAELGSFNATVRFLKSWSSCRRMSTRPFWRARRFVLCPRWSRPAFGATCSSGSSNAASASSASARPINWRWRRPLKWFCGATVVPLSGLRAAS